MTCPEILSAEAPSIFTFAVPLMVPFVERVWKTDSMFCTCSAEILQAAVSFCGLLELLLWLLPPQEIASTKNEVIMQRVFIDPPPWRMTFFHSRGEEENFLSVGLKL